MSQLPYGFPSQLPPTPATTTGSKGPSRTTPMSIVRPPPPLSVIPPVSTFRPLRLVHPTLASPLSPLRTPAVPSGPIRLVPPTTLPRAAAAPAQLAPDALTPVSPVVHLAPSQLPSVPHPKGSAPTLSPPSQAAQFTALHTYFRQTLAIFQRSGYRGAPAWSAGEILGFLNVLRRHTPQIWIYQTPTDLHHLWSTIRMECSQVMTVTPGANELFGYWFEMLRWFLELRDPADGRTPSTPSSGTTLWLAELDRVFSPVLAQSQTHTSPVQSAAVPAKRPMSSEAWPSKSRSSSPSRPVDRVDSNPLLSRGSLPAVAGGGSMSPVKRRLNQLNAVGVSYAEDPYKRQRQLVDSGPPASELPTRAQQVHYDPRVPGTTSRHGASGAGWEPHLSPTPQPSSSGSTVCPVSCSQPPTTIPTPLPDHLHRPPSALTVQIPTYERARRWSDGGRVSFWPPFHSGGSYAEAGQPPLQDHAHPNTTTTTPFPDLRSVHSLRSAPRPAGPLSTNLPINQPSQPRSVPLSPRVAHQTTFLSEGPAANLSRIVQDITAAHGWQREAQASTEGFQREVLQSLRQIHQELTTLNRHLSESRRG